MADNYIEKQQEQYEARKAAWKQEQKYGKQKTTVTPQVKSTPPAETTVDDSNKGALEKR